jgi:hypothetical protein
MALVVGFVVGLSPGFVGFTPGLFRFFTNRRPQAEATPAAQPI